MRVHEQARNDDHRECHVRRRSATRGLPGQEQDSDDPGHEQNRGGGRVTTEGEEEAAEALDLLRLRFKGARMRQHASQRLRIAPIDIGAQQQSGPQQLNGDCDRGAANESPAWRKQAGREGKAEHLRLEDQGAKGDTSERVVSCRPPSPPRRDQQHGQCTDLPVQQQLLECRECDQEKPGRHGVAPESGYFRDQPRPRRQVGGRRDGRPGRQGEQVRKQAQWRQQQCEHWRVYGQIQQPFRPWHLIGQHVCVGGPVIQIGGVAGRNQSCRHIKLREVRSLQRSKAVERARRADHP